MLKNESTCPVDAFQKLISGKYKLRIIWNLQDGPQRYSEIQRRLHQGIPGGPEIPARVLSRELKNLVQSGVLERIDYKKVPPKVEYTLTNTGRSFIPVISVMHEWGMKHLK